MTLRKYKLGKLIEQRREKNNNYSYPIYGVSREGFIAPKQKDVDTKLYNVFYKNDFVFNPARMEINSIAFNDKYDKCLCSSLYEIFFVKRDDILLPGYLNMFIKRDEFARQCEFIGWGSAREYCRVPDISEIEICLPTLEIQKKYVEIYNSTKNLIIEEQQLSDLRIVYNALLDKFKNSCKRINIGDCFNEIDERNTECQIKEIDGVNIEKRFIPSSSKVSKQSLKSYKIVKKGQFVYSSMQTGRDNCIRVAYLDDRDSVIVSPAYSVLTVNNDEILPEYLMMWFSRKEVDRRGSFMSDSSIRANLDLDRFFEMEIPLPSIKDQRRAVDVYKSYKSLLNINNQLKALIQSMSSVLIKVSSTERAV